MTEYWYGSTPAQVELVMDIVDEWIRQRGGLVNVLSRDWNVTVDTDGARLDVTMLPIPIGMEQAQQIVDAGRADE